MQQYLKFFLKCSSESYGLKPVALPVVGVKVGLSLCGKNIFYSPEQRSEDNIWT
jgi:hypothetical protein